MFVKFSRLAFINIPTWRICEFCIKMLLVSYVQDSLEGSKQLTAFRSFDNPKRREAVQVPTRSKSVLSAFFAKQKTPKLKASSFLWIHSQLISLWFKLWIMILSVAASLAMITPGILLFYSLACILLLSMVIYSVQASLKCIFVACYAKKQKKSFIIFVLQVLMYHQNFQDRVCKLY